MRVIGNIPHRKCNITFFHWNNRYLIKLEAGPFEQTFKVEEYDLASEDDLAKIVSDEFIDQAMLRFADMEGSISAAIEKI